MQRHVGGIHTFVFRLQLLLSARKQMVGNAIQFGVVYSCETPDFFSGCGVCAQEHPSDTSIIAQVALSPVPQLL